MSTVTVESTSNLQQVVRTGAHVFIADEPREAGGEDAGPGPYEYLLAALGTCTSMTLLIYARRKGIPLSKVVVELQHTRQHAQDCADCETREGFIANLERRIRLEGPLTAEQRARLLEIAAKCPVHRTLTREIKIRDQLVST